MDEPLNIVQLLKSAPEKFGGSILSVGEDDLLRVEQELGVRFPESYRQFLMYSDGGSFTDYRLYLFGIYEIESFNPDPDWSPDLPGMIFLGNDCGDDVFYFDPENYLGKGNWAVYSVGLGVCDFEYSRYEASSFGHLIERALNRERLGEGSWLKNDGTLPRPD
ncbi:MAG: SMI1/KNR4 family protein [Tildeniella nuda ZEHNDER 1965/U140]|jgi:hypothetical protein|nr:SMI1/KNR4 family protein [Tildeniella nuda ZEHNDER 1965/U140]